MNFPILTASSGSIAVNSTGDKYTFTPGCNVRIVAVKAIVEGTEATTATIALDKRVTAGSDTARGDADVAEIVLPASNQQGNIIYQKLENVEINADEQVVVQVTAASSGAKPTVVLIEYIRLDESVQNLDSAAETA